MGSGRGGGGSVLWFSAGDLGKVAGLCPRFWGASSTHHMLDRVGVERDHANGSCPLVVFLMDFLVEYWVVKEPGIK